MIALDEHEGGWREEKKVYWGRENEGTKDTQGSVVCVGRKARPRVEKNEEILSSMKGFCERPSRRIE